MKSLHHLDWSEDRQRRIWRLWHGLVSRLCCLDSGSWCRNSLHWQTSVSYFSHLCNRTMIGTLLFWTSRNSTGSFPPYLSFDLVTCGASVYVLGFWRLSYDSVEFVCCDQFALSFVPFCEDLKHIRNWHKKGEINRTDLCWRGTAQDARMDETRKLHVGNVTWCTEDSFKVPDSFCPDVKSVFTFHTHHQ